MNLDPLSGDDLLELDDILARDEIVETSMDVSMLHGYLTALVIGPATVMPSLWMPRVWDYWYGKAAPEFDSMAEAQRAMELIMRMNNDISRTFMTEPESFQPLWEDWMDAAPDAWCKGFLLATMHHEPYWQPLRDAHIEVFAPIGEMMREEAFDGLSNEEADAKFAELADGVVASVLDIYSYWLPGRGCQVLRPADRPVAVAEPLRREAPKVGRNDACPCGSGKKFKKCCGAGSNDG